MRLTLRTLMAYLDDALEPAQAKEIGEKIAESQVASELADRIRETLRRRRITAPQISGPGSGPDPNLAAEYLDNTLPAEAVAEFEHFCLDSDVHLAEVAACHQILTLVLGEQADVSTQLRERMYQLGAVAEPTTTNAGEVLAGTTTAAATEEERRMESAVAPAQSASFEDGLPQQLRRKSFVSRAIPAAIAVICVGWLALVFLDPHLWDRNAPPDGGEAALAVVPDDRGDPDEVAEPEAGPPDDQPTDEQPASVAVEPADGTTEPTEPEPPAEVTETEAGTPGETTEPAEPETTVAEANETEAPPVVPEPDPNAFEEPDGPATPPVDTATTLYNSPEGILLQRDPDLGWTVLPRRSLLHAGDEVACPRPFTARLQIDEGAFLVTLMGGARVRLTGPNEAGAFGMELMRGRVGVFRMPSEQAGPEPVSFGVLVDDRFYTVQLMVPDSWCGFDVVPEQPYGRGQPEQTATSGGGIFVARGKVRIDDSVSGAVEMGPENGWRSWTAEAEGAGPLLAVPNWLWPDGPDLLSSDRRYLTLYAKEFPIDLPVRQSIPAIVRDRRPMLSRLAVETLSLTGNYRELVPALKADHEEARLAAIVGLREWLLEDASHPDLLPGELTTSFRDDDAAAVEELLWGYTIDDGREAATSARLVEWLRSDEVAIRQLALFHIETLTGRDNDYHPTASPAQRDAAIGRWQDFLRRNGALVPATSP